MTLQIVYFALMTRILPPRSPKAFWIAEAVCQGVTLFFKPLYSAPLRLAIGMIGSMVVPMLLLRGSLPRRLVVCTLCLTAQTGAELAGVAVWMGLTGLQVMDNGLAFLHAPQFIAGVSVEIAVLALILSGLRGLCRRFFLLDDDGAGARRQKTTWLNWYVLFPLIQVVLVYFMAWVAFDVMRGDAPYLMATMALFALCMVVDVLLFVQMERSFKQRRAELEASVLEAQIDGYLQELTAMQALIDDTARLRHDLRNHQSIVLALCARGEHREAERYLEGARALMRSDARE